MTSQVRKTGHASSYGDNELHLTTQGVDTCMNQSDTASATAMVYLCNPANHSFFGMAASLVYIRAMDWQPLMSPERRRLPVIALHKREVRRQHYDPTKPILWPATLGSIATEQKLFLENLHASCQKLCNQRDMSLPFCISSDRSFSFVLAGRAKKIFCLHPNSQMKGVKFSERIKTWLSSLVCKTVQVLLVVVWVTLLCSSYCSDERDKHACRPRLAVQKI